MTHNPGTNDKHQTTLAGGKAKMIYLSPLPYESFAQRPHKFAQWFHDRTGGRVLWLDPYPTRLPRMADFRQSRSVDRFEIEEKPWLTVLPVRSLPIEPLPGGTYINRIFWREALHAIGQFSKDAEPFIAIGKPSGFANAVLDLAPKAISVYDMMDNFPAFYSGLSSRAMRRQENRIVARTSMVFCSSTNLLAKVRDIRSDPHLVLNALDPELPLPPCATTSVKKTGHVFGYVGTIARWFDWNIIRELAMTRPDDIVRIIGPLFNAPAFDLPPNVQILPAVRHLEALTEMRAFDVALIPFKENSLTAYVDPIKYYEYRALGLPILTTKFGEMSHRAGEDGLFFFSSDTLSALTDRALAFAMREEDRATFIAENSWTSRFNGSPLYSYLV